jgi:hypothetical protein
VDDASSWNDKNEVRVLIAGQTHGKNPLLRGSWLDETVLRFAR